MDLSFFVSALWLLFNHQCFPIRFSHPRDRLLIQGERGDIILPFILCLLTASLLFTSLFWLNKTYEQKTKEKLHDFQNRWNHLEKNTKTKAWWLKLGVALILSNIFFFLLFSNGETQEVNPLMTPGWVEVQLRADLMTPFQKGKKVLLIHRRGGQRVEGMLKDAIDLEGRLTILVKENEAAPLFLKRAGRSFPISQTSRFQF